MKRLIFESEDTRIEVFKNNKDKMVIVINDIDKNNILIGMAHVFDDDSEFREFIKEANKEVNNG